MTEKEYDAIVVGSGFSGMTAARDLRDRGMSVLILEANDRIGGRAYSRTFQGRSETIEMGGGWVSWDGNPQIRREIERYGIEMKADAEPKQAVFVTGGERRTGFPVPASELVDLERAWFYIRQQALRVDASRPVSGQAIADADVTADEFFASLSLPPATKDFIYAMLAAFNGTDPNNVSMLWPLTQVAAFNYSPLGYYTGLDIKFKYGTTSLIDAMFKGSGAELRLRAKVTSVVQNADGVEVHFGPEIIRGKAVVVAVPTNVLSDIDFSPPLAETKRAATKQPHPGRQLKCNMLVDGLDVAPVCLGGSVFQLVIPMYEVEEGRWLLTGFAQHDLNPIDPTNVADAQRGMSEYFPDVRVLAADGHDWGADPCFRGTWRVDPPGSSHEFTRVMNEPEDRVILAGADIVDDVWRVWFEGAVRSGHRAADYVAARLERDRN